MITHFVVKQGESYISIKKDSIYSLRVYGSVVEIQYGFKQLLVMTKFGNEKILMDLCTDFGFTEEEVMSQWSDQ